MRNRRGLSPVECRWRARDGSCHRRFADEENGAEGHKCPLGYDYGELPRWDAETRAVTFGENLVKQFRQPAKKPGKDPCGVRGVGLAATVG